MSDKIYPSVSVFPKILLVNRQVIIHLFMEHLNDGAYQIEILPVSNPVLPSTRVLGLEFVNGRATLLFTPPTEQEYKLNIKRNGKLAATTSVYSVDVDLYELIPLKSDFHMHSVYSDGLEIPAEVAAQGRLIGLDVMGITDHSLYMPSLEAIEAFDGLMPHFCLCPGEEVHPPDNPVHIVSFGAQESICDLFSTRKYSEEVSDIQGKLDSLPENCDKHQYASTLWVFDRIRQSGGMGIFCHPYWKNSYNGALQEFNISEALTDQIFRDRPFDAYEILGGYDFSEQDANTLQIARYFEERINNPLPIVGVSDAHGCYEGLFGWYFTIVFAKQCKFDDVKNAIRSCLSVAVENLPGRECRVYGPARLVKYTLFLLKEFFPGHDEICFEEGVLMMRLIKGDTEAGFKLKSYNGLTKDWINKCFGK